METLVRSIVLTACFAFVAGYPADHREDTVLPFSLSPGNVNLETYYLDKYPKPSPGGPIIKEELPEEGNMFVEDMADEHALIRSVRSPFPQHHHHGSGHGHHHHHHHQPSYHHDFHHQGNHHHHHNPHHHHGHHHHYGR